MKYFFEEKQIIVLIKPKEAQAHAVMRLVCIKMT